MTTIKHGTRSGYNKCGLDYPRDERGNRVRCPECRSWGTDRKRRQRGGDTWEPTSTLVNGVLPWEDPETVAAYQTTMAIQNGTADEATRAHWEANLANRAEDGRRHGTVTGYTKDGCRCDECRTAMREYQREYRKRKKAERAAGRAQQSGDPGLARDGFAAFPWEIETN